MDYLPVSLHDVIHKNSLQNKFMSESDISWYSFQLIRAVSHLWRLNICHRDIKPQNIVCDPISKKIRLCDFGSAKQLNDGEWNKHYICSRFYRAPELLCELNYYSCSVDGWSLGCVIAEMYLNKPLFNGRDTKDQLKLISKILGPIPSSNYPDPKYTKKLNEYKISAKQWQKRLSVHSSNNEASLEGGDFIRNLLCYVPQQRFNLKTLKCLNHPFVSKFLPINKPETQQKLKEYPKIEFFQNENELV